MFGIFADGTPQRVLEPSERIAEMLFGLIMVLTFTGSLSVAEAGRDDVRTMLIGALGCNIAWGVIDGILYILGCLAEKGRNLRILRQIRTARDERQATRAIEAALPKVIFDAMQQGELESIRQRLRSMDEPTARARVDRSDILGAIGVFLLVVVSTFPVALPFLLVQSASHAMRLSNAIAVGMLFLLGYAYGRSIGRSPTGFGITMVVLGSVLVALTMALGG